MQKNLQSERKNPYIAGNPIVDPTMFYGRQDVFDWIRSNIEGHTLIIHGQRRVGKTSVLHQLSRCLPSQYITVYCDLQGRTSSSLELFLFGLAREIARVIKTQYGINLETLAREKFENDPDYFERIFLTSISRLLPNVILLICLDEYDVMEDNPIRDQRGRALADLIRPMLGRRNINFIFSIGSSGRKLEYMKGSFTALFKTALYKKISFLRKEDTFRLIAEPVQDVLDYQHDAMEYIYQITSGHPYYVQLICHELFSLFQKNGHAEVTVKDIESIIDDVVERGTVNLKFIWDEAVPLEKWCLASLAQLKSGNRTGKEIMDFLRAHDVAFTNQEVASALLHLREEEVLDPYNDFKIYLLDIWLRQNWPIEKVIETIGLLEGTEPTSPPGLAISPIPQPGELLGVNPSTREPQLSVQRRSVARWAWLVGLVALIGLVALVGWAVGIYYSGLAATQTLRVVAALSPTSTMPSFLAATRTPQALAVAPTATPAPPTSSASPAPTQTENPAATDNPTPTLTPTLGVGSTQISPKDGMVMVYVPAAEFLMGSDKAKDSQAESDELPQHTVYLDDFWIDQTEVTNAQYARCVADGECSPPFPTSSNTRSSYYGDGQYDDYPVVGINWIEVHRYCNWAGRWLPSEAEWEKAARGVDGRIYPWGDAAPDQSLLNYNRNEGDTTAVGSYPSGASPYGVLDMAGNVWEWVSDGYSDSYYQQSPADNPTGPVWYDNTVLRGGAWDIDDKDIRSANRYGISPFSSSGNIGFRCAAWPWF